MAGKKPKQTIGRYYRFEGKEKWQKDTDLPIWEGQTVNGVVSSMYDGTNFVLANIDKKKNKAGKTIVYQTLRMKK